jgi:hypothetical protein
MAAGGGRLKQVRFIQGSIEFILLPARLQMAMRHDRVSDVHRGTKRNDWKNAMPADLTSPWPGEARRTGRRPAAGNGAEE